MGSLRQHVGGKNSNEINRKYTCFDYESPEGKERRDYTDLKNCSFISARLFSLRLVRQCRYGLSVCIALGMVILAIKLRWHLREHAGSERSLHSFWRSRPTHSYDSMAARKRTYASLQDAARNRGFPDRLAALMMGEKLFLRNSSSPESNMRDCVEVLESVPLLLRVLPRGAWLEKDTPSATADGNDAPDAPSGKIIRFP